YTLISRGKINSRFSVKLFLSMAFAMISLVAATNFFVDPESIYNKRSSLSRNVESYVEAVSRSPYGMVYESGERAIKRRLANISNAECFVVGS
ncbi:hypothetical protein ACS2TD_26900, partial [Bacillus cereus group sp. BC334]|uniref:hypothetical protein n=1 Tax=Bacillus cereus group sp. BC334 TaxID=3445305 RepID=UPI003F25FAE6